MPTSPHPTFLSTLGETALAAAGGGTLVMLESDPTTARAGAVVLSGGELLRVELDAVLGTASVQTATADVGSSSECRDRSTVLA